MKYQIEYLREEIADRVILQQRQEEHLHNEMQKLP